MNADHAHMANRSLLRKVCEAASIPRLAILIAVALAGLLWSLHGYADSLRTVQVLVERLRSVAQEVKSLEGQTASLHTLDEPTRREIADTRRAASLMIARIRDVGVGADELRRVTEAIPAYLDAALKRFARIRTGRINEFPGTDKKTVDADYERLIATIQQASASLDGQASRAKRVADLGSSIALVLSALFMALLFQRFERAHNHSTRLLTEQKLLVQREEYVHALLGNVSDIILVMDANGTLGYISEAMERVLGYAEEVHSTRCFLELVHPSDTSSMRELLEADPESAQRGASEIRLLHSDTSWRLFEVSARNLLEHPEIKGILVTCRDITERTAFEEQIAHQAFHDALTGLPNRTLFLDCLTRAQARMHRRSGPIAVLFLDLDNFKRVNDTLGHGAGDTLLLTVAKRLLSCVRPEDTVARLGGDEFIVLLENPENVEGACHAAERITQALRAPIQAAGTELFATVSIGIAYSEDPSEQPDNLLRDADTAMYEVKSHDKSGWCLFAPSMNERLVERVQLESEMTLALYRNEFRMHYQPIINLYTGELDGMEALIRWEHPERGLVVPGKFIPIAEETGLIVPIGYWALEEACRQAEEWINATSKQQPFTMSVNLSGKQLQRPEVVECVRAILEKTCLPPSALKLEITESVIMHNVDEVVTRLIELKALGVKLAIDDFGTGYSSMAYLSVFPLDTIKIDQSFVSRITENREATSIVEAIIRLSKALNFDVTAEGIETEEQLEILQGMDCSTGQGYFFARPLAAASMAPMMASKAQFLKVRDSAEAELIERLLNAA